MPAGATEATTTQLEPQPPAAGKGATDVDGSPPPPDFQSPSVGHWQTQKGESVVCRLQAPVEARECGRVSVALSHPCH